MRLMSCIINGFIGFNIVYIFGSLSSVYTKNPYSFLPVLVFVVESGYRIPPRECSCQSWFHFSELVTEKLLKYIEHFFHSFSSFPQRNGNNETFVPLQIAVYFELLNKIIYFIYREGTYSSRCPLSPLRSPLNRKSRPSKNYEDERYY